VERLVKTQDVTGIPAAAELTDRELEMAAEDVRGECGWHVAPVLTTTAQVSGTGGSRLRLPTRRVVEVVSVVAATDPDETPIPGWREVPGPMLARAAGWPCGDGNLLVTLSHGYERCPADLLAVVLERARVIHDPVTPGVTHELRTSGDVSRSRTYSGTGPQWTLAATAILDRYRVVG